MDPEMRRKLVDPLQSVLGRTNSNPPRPWQEMGTSGSDLRRTHPSQCCPLQGWGGQLALDPIYVGQHGSPGALLALPEFGAVLARSNRQLASRGAFPGFGEGERAGMGPEQLETAVGRFPEEVVGHHRNKTVACPCRLQMLRKYGGTAACEACAQVFIKGRTDTSHSDAGRNRMMELLEGDDEGRARIEARKKRKAVSSAGDDVKVSRACSKCGTQSRSQAERRTL